MSCSNGIGDIETLGDQETNSPRELKTQLQVKVKKANRKFSDEVDFDIGSVLYKSEYTRDVPGTQSIFVRTFGCSHNISDSEFMMGLLADYGYKLVNSVDNSDLVLINSCTVKTPSQDAMMTFSVIVKEANSKGKKVVVAGCVPSGDKKNTELGDYSQLGTTSIDQVVEVVQETLKGNVVKLFKGNRELPSLDLPKIRRNKLIEIIPINTGCLGACTYCKTIHARGKLGSYPVVALKNRLKDVIEEGVKDIWLTSEDTGAYGRDINSSIAHLLKELVLTLSPDTMMRIGMTNPPYMKFHMPQIAKILNHPNVYSFLHIPVQSGNNNVLHNMNREYTVEEFKYVCDYLLEHVPGVTIATDIICGFPGETDEEFEDTLKLIEKYKLPVVNISQFYPRPGTAAARMKKVPTKQVKERSRKITTLFESYRCYDHLEGKELLVWAREVESNKKYGRRVIGHTKSYTKVVLPNDDTLVGTCILLKCTKAFKWHIEGEIIKRNVMNSPINPNYFSDYFHEEQVSTDTDSKNKDEAINIGDNVPYTLPQTKLEEKKKFFALLVLGIFFISLGIISYLLKQPGSNEF